MRPANFPIGSSITLGLSPDRHLSGALQVSFYLVPSENVISLLVDDSRHLPSDKYAMARISM